MKRTYEIDILAIVSKTLVVCVEEDGQTPDLTREYAIDATKRAIEGDYWRNFAKLAQRGMAPPVAVEAIVGNAEITDVRDVTVAEVGR